MWYDKKTAEVFWRSIPRDKFDSSRHGFKAISPDENYVNIKKIIELILKYRPGAKIIITLSPIPLVATFRDLPCILSNTYSKSSLRCALDRVYSEYCDQIFYFPSYEIVLNGFVNNFEPDLRHIKKPILSFIMKLFQNFYCVGGIADKELSHALYKAKKTDGTINYRLAKKLNLLSLPEIDTCLTSLTEGKKISDALKRTITEAYVYETAGLGK